MKILLLGGPKFLGRAIADAVLDGDHELTFFNRGQTEVGLYPDVERLRGDRDGGLDVLRGRSWDAVIDTSGYVPRVVQASAELLADAVDHYVFVSSVSVYESFEQVNTEASPMLPDPASEDVGEHYGALKAACEHVVDAALPGRATYVRAGLIVGPHDPTGRFTYWPHRVQRGGEILVPGSLDRPVQIVDVRDLAAWMVQCAAERVAGAYNAIGSTTMGKMLDAAVAVTGAEAVFTEVSPSFLAEQGVGEWLEVPVWNHEANIARRRFFEVDGSKAITAGLTFRPLEETIAGTLAEADTVDGVGLTPAREAELLGRWENHRVSLPPG